MVKLKKFILRYWIFILLATLATMLGGFYLKARIYPPEIKEKLLSIPAPKIESYSISISPNISKLNQDFPLSNQKAEVYQVNPPFVSDQEALKIAQNFGFFDQPTVFRDNKGGVSYSWSKEENFLSINLREGKISYGLDLLSRQELIKGAPPLLSTTEVEIKNFLKENNFFPPKEIQLEIKDSYYAKIGMEYFEKTSLEDKDVTLAHFEFRYKINNKKIEGLEFSPFINIYVGPEFKIARFDYQPSFKTITLLNSYPLKTKEEIIKKITTNPQVSFLKISGESIVLSEESKNITNLSFDNIELVYYKYDPLQSYLQPVFLITGKARLKDGQEGEVGLFIPAIKDEYLLK